MKTMLSRRGFCGEVGRGMLIVTVGSQIARELGLAGGLAEENADTTLSFGPLEPLVVLMQETPPDHLLPVLTDRMKSGTSLRELTAAAALANARTFGGEDYVGFHTMMALAPALHMSSELPAARSALPVFKVLYRNTNRIQEHGGRTNEVLHPVVPAAGDVREAIHAGDVAKAEQALAMQAASSPDAALNELLTAVQDTGDVHRVVLPYRAWDLMSLIGQEHALTLLRQSVRYCVRGEQWANRSPYNEPRTLLPQLLEECKLLDREPGTREADDAWVENLSQTFFNATPSDAAAAAASALAEGFSPAAVGEAIALTANQLVLRDHGRTPEGEVPGKPIGSVHGDSIGVHASDSANAWKNLARVSNARNTFACLILGAWQVAKDRVERGGDFAHWEPLPLKRQVEGVKSTDPTVLLSDLDEAIRGNLQARAAAIAGQYGALGHEPRALFDLLLGYAISEDGALHAEKYFRTTSEEFAAARPAFRWRHAIGLARITASEYGRPAP
ncbi:MAG: hypothetical protein ABI680_17705, partial [Chthoniobacteraceae bacterium]